MRSTDRSRTAPVPTGAGSGLSRRALFGSGLSQALGAAFPEEAAPRPTRPGTGSLPTDRGEGEADSLRLGGQLAPVADLVMERLGLTEGPELRVAVVAAGDGKPMVAGALAAGHAITALEADADLVQRGLASLPEADWRQVARLPWPVAPGAFDAVVAWFGVSYVPDPRGVAAELRRIVRPGGWLALTSWTPQAMTELRGHRPASGHRPERWSRYETAYRHLFDFPELDVEPWEVGVVLEQDGPGVALQGATVVARVP